MRFVKKKKKKKKTRIKHYMNVCVNGNISKKKKKSTTKHIYPFFLFFYNDDKESRFSWILNFCVSAPSC